MTREELEREGEAACEWCREGVVVGKIISGTSINGFYAHRINNQDVPCAADHIWQQLNGDVSMSDPKTEARAILDAAGYDLDDFCKETREEDCKAMCSLCDDNTPLLQPDGEYHHRMPWGGEPCQASPIRELER